MAMIKYQLAATNLAAFVTAFNEYYSGSFVATLDTTAATIFKVSDKNNNPLLDINFGGGGQTVKISIYRNGSVVSSYGDNMGYTIYRYPIILMAANGFIIHQLASAYNDSYRNWVSAFCTMNADGNYIAGASPMGATSQPSAPTTIDTIEPLNSFNTTTRITLVPNTTLTPTCLCNVWTEGGGSTPSVADNAFLYVCSPYISNVGAIALNGKNYVTNGYWCIKD